MALINRKLSGIETSFLMADEKHSHISSTLIRELAKWKTTLPGFVPDSISAEVFAKLGVPYDADGRVFGPVKTESSTLK
jgi:pantetheine-phosphate adenylyltransferase